MPNLWETFLIHFRRIAGWTFLVMVVAAGVSLILPKTYRASTTVMVLPPRYAATLEVPPQPLAMPSIQAIATSYPVLQDLLADLAVKRELVSRIASRSTDASTGSPSAMSATQAAELLEVPKTEVFEKAWSGMPPEDLISGFSDFTDRDLADLDPIELSKSLAANIRTSMETNLTTRYQPIRTLSGDWRTPEGAALLSCLWARAVSRALDEEIVSASLRVQEEKRDRIEAILKSYRTARSAPFEYLAYHPVDLWASEAKALKAIGGNSPEANERLAEIEEKIGKSLGQMETLRENFRRVSEEFHYTLEHGGGIEALVEDYPLLLRVTPLAPPSPPKQKIHPRRSAIVLVAGALAFLILLGRYHIAEIRRMDQKI